MASFQPWWETLSRWDNWRGVQFNALAHTVGREGAPHQPSHNLMKTGVGVKLTLIIYFDKYIKEARYGGKLSANNSAFQTQF
jgi:hypothetical protein